MTKSFFNENWQELESQTGSEVTSYIWGLRYIDDLVLREKGTERLYSLADPNWNVVAICDTNGDIIERMKYDAFGKITWLDNNFSTKNDSDYNWNRTFTGQVLDTETGLMHYRRRDYDPALGRFTNRDPIEYKAEDVNLYRYVSNRSIVHQDLTGEFVYKPPKISDVPSPPPPLPWWFPIDPYDPGSYICPLGSMGKKVVINGICKNICEKTPCKKLSGPALESAQKAKRALKNKKSDFSNWFHNEYKKREKISGINRRNPDMCDEELADAWDIWMSGVVNSPK